MLDKNNGDADSLLSNVLLAEQRAYDYGWKFLTKTLPNTGVQHSDWIKGSYKNSVIARDRRYKEAEAYLMKKNLKKGHDYAVSS